MSEVIGVDLPRLGPGAGELLASLGVPVSRAVVISTLRSAATRRGCYRIELENGRMVKLRRSTTEGEARQYARLIVALGDPRLARVFDRRGDLTLEEWVMGTTLDRMGAGKEHLTAGAELLGTLHATRRIGASSLPRTVSTQPVRDQLEADLRTVLAMGAIDGSLATRLRAGAARQEPGVASVGVLHTDLCPENLVVDARGVVRAIDNEGMRIGPAGFDLARVWYRWPMSESEWRAYVSVYARFVDPGATLEHFMFWKIAAVLQSARIRLTRRTLHADLPLRRLVALADEL